MKKQKDTNADSKLTQIKIRNKVMYILPFLRWILCYRGS